jgi:hypothetical protein
MGNAAPAEERVSTAINRPGRLTTEEEIILLVLRYPTVPWKESLETITWSDERCLRVWNLMSECEAVQEWPVKDWLTHFSGPDQDWLIQLSLEERFYKKPDSALQDWVAAWSRDQDQKRFKVLQKQVARMMEGQEPSLPAVIDEYHTLAKQLKGSVSSSPGGQGT